MEIILYLLTILLITAFLFVRVTKGGEQALILKAFASIGFVSIGIWGLGTLGVINGFTWLLILGLVFSLLGDIVLDLKVCYPNKNNIYLNSGLFSFSLTHICYIIFTIGFCSLSSYMWQIFTALGIGLIFATVINILAKPILKLDFGKFKWQSFAYTVVLVTSTFFTLFISFSNSKFIIMAVGLILFLLSDLVLSLMYFGGKEKNNLLCIINHSLYYIGQILIASIFFI